MTMRGGASLEQQQPHGRQWRRDGDSVYDFPSVHQDASKRNYPRSFEKGRDERVEGCKGETSCTAAAEVAAGAAAVFQADYGPLTASPRDNELDEEVEANHESHCLCDKP